MIGRVQKFVSEVTVELRKVAWATKQELVDATWIVLISTAFLGIFIATTDLALSKLLTLIIR